MMKSFSCLSKTIILLLMFCLLGLAIGWGITQMISLAQEIYGPPAENLGLFQRIYLSAILLIQKNDLTQPHNPEGPEQKFVVEIGEPLQRITLKLESQGLIPNAEALNNLLQYSGLDTTLQAGEYILSPQMSPLKIAHSLQDATPQEITFNILPGWRLEEIAAALPTSGLNFSPEAFLIKAAQPPLSHPLTVEIPVDASLEGFLMPDSYLLPRGITLPEFLTTVLDNFLLKVDESMRQGFSQQGLTLYQAITLASIVQREAIIESEMPTIASVFYNRLAIGMKLDSDPTVQYALGYNADQGTWWTNPLSLEELQIESPFNTYLYPGLPPGPIANPGINALRAIAFPEKTNYYYFRAACDGSGRHLFAQTFEEHRSNTCP